jgi:hypothetical protein
MIHDVIRELVDLMMISTINWGSISVGSKSWCRISSICWGSIGGGGVLKKEKKIKLISRAITIIEYCFYYFNNWCWCGVLRRKRIKNIVKSKQFIETQHCSTNLCALKIINDYCLILVR